MRPQSPWEALSPADRRNALELAGVDLQYLDQPQEAWPIDIREKAARGVGKMNRTSKVFNGPAPIRPAPRMQGAAMLDSDADIQKAGKIWDGLPKDRRADLLSSMGWTETSGTAWQKWTALTQPIAEAVTKKLKDAGKI